MAETIKKGARITEADPAKIVGELTEDYADAAFREVPNESAAVPEGVAGEEPRAEG
jgi:hypothetical protein